MNSGATPLFLPVVILGGLIMFFAPRKFVVPTFLAWVIFVSMIPKIVIFGQNFMMHRLLLLCVWPRIVARREYEGFQFSNIDKAVAAFYAWTLIGDSLLWGTGSQFVYQTANCVYDALGIYFLFRLMIRDAQDYKRAIIALAGVCVALAVFMCAEYLTHRNWLAILGQIQDTVQVRKGRLRCQGAFGVPITAGTFGAVLLPFFVACWWQGGKFKRYAIFGSIAATVITVTAGSGGPLTTYAASLLGLVMWRFRFQMRGIRWTVCSVLMALHFIMQAPVWAIISRLQVVPGNSSYHRYAILDTFIRNIGQWWFLGIQSTADWGWEMDDVANQYCVVAKHGGILSVLLFVRVLYLCFKEVGLRIRDGAVDRPTEFLIWSAGVMLFAHCVSFIGISYFDQMKFLWFLSLALVAALPLLTRPQAEVVQTEPHQSRPDQEWVPAQGIS